MPFTNSLDPVLLHLWQFQIRYYGLAWVFGFFLVYYAMKRAVKRKELEISEEKIENYMVYLILSVILGARLFHVLFSDPTYYFSNLAKIFAVWEGGVAFHGGLTGGVLATYYFVRKNNISWKKLGDLVAIPLVFALGIGRIANFINGELWGTVTDVSWCVNFQNVFGCRHPTQIYEALANFSIFGILLFFKREDRKEGFVFFMFILLMGISRFLISFLREDPKFLGLSDGQYFSLIMIIISCYILFRKK